MIARNSELSLKKYGAVLVALLVCWAGAGEAAYVITIQGSRVEGSDIRAKANGEIILTTDQGTRTFYKGQYKRAVADKPGDFDKARKCADSGDHQKAIELFRGIITKYRYLEWDNRARMLLPLVCVDKGDYKAAVEAYEDMFRALPQSLEDEDVTWSYREALLKADKYEKLTAVLDKIIQKNERNEAARAQIMRGDINRARGQLEPAVLDYLRTMVLFKEVTARQPEATFKAAEILGEMHDRRAKDLYKTIVEQYPDSPYAAEARSKL